MTAEPAANTSGRLRVVLLGRSGLDATLRADAGVEIVRAGSPLEAVGEVASPPASAVGATTVVAVGRDGEPNAHRAAFFAALREADPAAHVVRIASNGSLTPEEASEYDAVLGEAVTPDLLRDAVLRVGPARHAETGEPEASSEPGPAGEQSGPEPAPEARAPTEPAPFTEAHEDPIVTTRAVGVPAGRSSQPGDAALLEAMKHDRGTFLRAARRILRDRLGDDARFDDDPGAEGVPVVAAGVRQGVLRDPTGELGHDRLAPHAAWLAGWLALFDSHKALRKAAFTDSLTGAWNRRYFDGFLRAAIDRARERRRTVTVLVFDIDEFKQYNDRFGHPAGDEILIETVKALRSSVRPEDRVCRIGGDEFAVIFDEPDGPRESGSRPPESVYVLARRVQKMIGERRFPKLGADAPGPLTISGGLAAFPWDGHDAETLLHRADELSCQSKQQGKNAITLGPGAERVCRNADDECED